MTMSASDGEPYLKPNEDTVIDSACVRDAEKRSRIIWWSSWVRSAEVSRTTSARSRSFASACALGVDAVEQRLPFVAHRMAATRLLEPPQQHVVGRLEEEQA